MFIDSLALAKLFVGLLCRHFVVIGVVDVVIALTFEFCWTM